MKTQKMLRNIIEKIPLTRHMGLEVLVCSIDRVSIQASFEKNRNHKMTAFGGSVATVLTLACWSWITNYLYEQGLEDVEVSIHRCQIDYNQPITKDFIGICDAPQQGLDQFEEMLQRKNKGRLSMSSFVFNEQQVPMVFFTGDFVAYKVNNLNISGQ